MGSFIVAPPRVAVVEVGLGGLIEKLAGDRLGRSYNLAPGLEQELRLIGDQRATVEACGGIEVAPHGVLIDLHKSLAADSSRRFLLLNSMIWSEVSRMLNRARSGIRSVLAGPICASLLAGAQSLDELDRPADYVGEKPAASLEDFLVQRQAHTAEMMELVESGASQEEIDAWHEASAGRDAKLREMAVALSARQ